MDEELGMLEARAITSSVHRDLTLMATGFAALPPSSPSSTAKKLKQILREQFKALEDPRVKRKPEHSLVNIVAIAILAVLSGANDLVAVETYGKAKQTWLETFLELPNGIPSHDTFSRVLALLNPQQLHECFLSWVAQLADELAIKLINIDGQTRTTPLEPNNHRGVFLHHQFSG
jgi:hypothetical protein